VKLSVSPLLVRTTVFRHFASFRIAEGNLPDFNAKRGAPTRDEYNSRFP
jgi:hypothetical protein